MPIIDSSKSGESTGAVAFVLALHISFYLAGDDMQIYLSIDDTDNLESIGSGQLAENLTAELLQSGLVAHCSNITRHQLFYNEKIPYTSHNSSMCFTANLEASGLSELIDFSIQYLKSHSAPGSDPGLCVAHEDGHLDKDALIRFGEQAKRTVLSKKLAYDLAEKMNVHLSEHGGTGDGIIGALAGIGLRMQGNDGRFRGWFNFGQAGEITTPKMLCEHADVAAVVDETGSPLAADSPIRITDEKIKTILHNHIQVIPVQSNENADGVRNFATLSRKEVKKF